MPAPVPMAVAGVGNVDNVYDVGDTVVVAGTVVALIVGLPAVVALGVAAPALFPIPDDA
jgi:hypothetical protein